MNLEPPSFSNDLRRYLLLLWRWAWLLILAAVLAAGAAYYTSRRMVPVYSASTLVLVNEAPSNKAMDYTAVMTSERLAKTYAELMTTQPVLDGVIQRLGLDLLSNELAKSVQVQPVRDTQLIQVSVEDTDPARAAAIANAIVAEFAEQNAADQASRYAASKESFEAQLADIDRQIEATNAGLSSLGKADAAERDRLETALSQYRSTYASLLAAYEQVRLAEAQTTSSVVQKEPAVPPTTPIRPRTLQNTALAGVVGLMLAIGAAFLVEALDDSLKDTEDITRTLGIPVLGVIAHHETEGGMITTTQPRAPVSEAFRALRTNLKFSSPDQPLRALLVTSPSPNEGKTMLSANLATILAQAGSQVVLIDADLRRPSLHRLVDLPNRDGVSSLIVQTRGLDGRLHLNGQVQESAVPNLRVITSGSLPPNPAELLGSNKMGEVLETLKFEADIVVIDTPPVLAVTDATVLAPRADGVILIAKPGETKLAALRQAVEQLQRVGANLLGVVLNDVPLKRSRYAYYNYKGYYDAYQDEYGYSSDRPRHKKRLFSKTRQ